MRAVVVLLTGKTLEANEAARHLHSTERIKTKKRLVAFEGMRGWGGGIRYPDNENQPNTRKCRLCLIKKKIYIYVFIKNRSLYALKKRTKTRSILFRLFVFHSIRIENRSWSSIILNGYKNKTESFFCKSHIFSWYLRKTLCSTQEYVRIVRYTLKIPLKLKRKIVKHAPIYASNTFDTSFIWLELYVQLIYLYNLISIKKNHVNATKFDAVVIYVTDLGFAFSPTLNSHIHIESLRIAQSSQDHKSRPFTFQHISQRNDC